MDYVRKYLLLSPEVYARLKEIEKFKTKGDPLDIKVKKLNEEYVKNQQIAKNQQNDFFDTAASTLQRIGLVSKQPPFPGGTNGGPGSSASSTSSVASAKTRRSSSATATTVREVDKSDIANLSDFHSNEGAEEGESEGEKEANGKDSMNATDDGDEDMEDSLILKPDHIDWVCDYVNSTESNMIMQGRVIDLIYSLYYAKGIVIKTDEITIDGQTLNIPIKEIFQNLIRTAGSLEPDMRILLDKIVSNPKLYEKVLKSNSLVNYKALNYLKRANNGTLTIKKGSGPIKTKQKWLSLFETKKWEKKKKGGRSQKTKRRKLKIYQQKLHRKKKIKQKKIAQKKAAVKKQRKKFLKS